MLFHRLILIIHLTAAAIWVGGHLILALVFLPKALKHKDHRLILRFEKGYEWIGIPALLVLVISGMTLAYQYDVPVQHWFDFTGSIERVVSFKLLLLFTTAGLGIHARLRLIPKLNNKNMVMLAVHIIAVTLVGVIMLILGSTIRWGGI